ncbi:rhodanese-like domain-containing protein [Verrucomicrobium sp. BvORR034]|uniref:rhodanese-like domain-containing protein n=1 Tax=Verrucomicrobium sp. BvORR034 TaxID=1396418 RepID=UPI0009DED5DF|nr:rhodanese-like domain-containing protein [Verrucomicrobium sp. BvORR034]
MKIFVQAGMILVLTLVAAAVTQRWHPRAPAWYVADERLADDEVTLALVQEKWKGEVLWIDARPRTDYEAGHVPGAVLLNEQEADSLMFDLFEKLQDNTKPIVVYCSGEACQASRKIRQYLKDRVGAQEIYVLRGGWKDAQSLGSAQK